MEQCYGAGIRPVMITGDHRLTALAIAKELGIFRPGRPGGHRGGPGLHAPGDAGAGRREFSVYARVSPEHKMRIVSLAEAGQGRGHDGDGVNDAPALRPPISDAPWACPVPTWRKAHPI